tara:strand:+ start:2853 stop:5042 length:2190 start_codon:yes stop_codon:yes gene_type:complete
MKTLSYSIYFIFLCLVFTQDYLWPTNASNTLTAFFAEERPHRYHAGIDIRTYGKNGFDIYAIENGYIERVKTNYSGYGKTIYLRLDDGNSAVYAHLDKFYPKLEEIVKILIQKYNSSVIDHTFSKEEFRVEKGDIIGFTGDTGTISGPHLHFEIRDKNNICLNPLTTFYSIDDNIKPIPNKIALTPLSHTTKINGNNNVALFDIIKGNNDNEYFIKDTIAVKGEFGLSLSIFDKIDKQPFSYGLYKIELYIDGDLQYKVQYDEHNFSQGQNILKERNYFLKRYENERYYNLFNFGDELTFIDKNSKKSYEFSDGNTHNITIKASDINNNEIIIFGTIIADNIKELNYEIFENKDFIEFKIDQNDSCKKYKVDISNKYDAEINEILTFTNKNIIIDKNSIQSPFNCISVYGIERNGLKTKKIFYQPNDNDLKSIQGEFQIITFKEGVVFQFIESEFTNSNAIISLITDKKINYKTNRVDQNILSTELIYYKNLLNLNSISIEYDTNPNIEIVKNINSDIYIPNENFYLFDKNFSIDFTNVYNDTTLIYIETTKPSFNSKNFEFLSDIYSILPFSVPFENKAKINFSETKNKGVGIYYFDEKNQRWKFVDNKYNDNQYYANIKSNQSFCLIKEVEPPKISNLIPDIDATYRTEDITEIKFNIDDNFSDISKIENIKLKLNDKELLFDFNLYQKKITYELEELLTLGSHELEIQVSDNVGNTIVKKGEFIVK